MHNTCCFHDGIRTMDNLVHYNNRIHRPKSKSWKDELLSDGIQESNSNMLAERHKHLSALKDENFNEENDEFAKEVNKLVGRLLIYKFV